MIDINKLTVGQELTVTNKRLSGRKAILTCKANKLKDGWNTIPIKYNGKTTNIDIVYSTTEDMLHIGLKAEQWDLIFRTNRVVNNPMNGFVFLEFDDFASDSHFAFLNSYYIDDRLEVHFTYYGGLAPGEYTGMMSYDTEFGFMEEIPLTLHVK